MTPQIDIRIGDRVKFTPEHLKTLKDCQSSYPEFSELLKGGTAVITLIMYPSVYIGNGITLLALSPDWLELVERKND